MRVGEQNQRLPRGLERHVAVFRAAQNFERFVFVDERTIEQAALELHQQYSPHGPIDVRYGHQATTICLLEPRQKEAARPKIHIHAGLDGQRAGLGRVAGDPMSDQAGNGGGIGDHVALEAPFLSQHPRQQVAIGRARDSVDVVIVRQHHFLGTTFGCLASQVLRCDCVACLFRST